jgi:hypothetical protein
VTKKTVGTQLSNILKRSSASAGGSKYKYQKVATGKARSDEDMEMITMSNVQSLAQNVAASDSSS